MTSDITPDTAVDLAAQLDDQEQANNQQRHKLQQEALKQAAYWAEEHRRLKEEAENASNMAKQWAVAALKIGNDPGEVAKTTGWTPAWLRRIAKGAGLPPATRGPRPRKR